MLAPGCTFSSGRVTVTAGAGTVPDFRGPGGIGFMNNGSLAIDTNAPAGTSFIKGFRISAAGALYGTTTPSGTDVWIEGIRVSSLGQIVYESAAAAGYASGNPVTSNGRFAVI